MHSMPEIFKKIPVFLVQKLIFGHFQNCKKWNLDNKFFSSNWFIWFHEFFWPGFFLIFWPTMAVEVIVQHYWYTQICYYTIFPLFEYCAVHYWQLSRYEESYSIALYNNIKNKRCVRFTKKHAREVFFPISKR